MLSAQANKVDAYSLIKIFAGYVLSQAPVHSLVMTGTFTPTTVHSCSTNTHAHCNNQQLLMGILVLQASIHAH